MSGLDPLQFRQYVIDPVLNQLGLYSPAASNLLLGTALQESRLVYVTQLQRGPARGLYQLEMASHDDIVANYLPFKPELYSKIINLKAPSLTAEQNLVMNMAYATAMCRIFYLRIPDALPDSVDALAMAKYWKQWYNSPQGAGTVDEALSAFGLAITTPMTGG